MRIGWHRWAGSRHVLGAAGAILVVLGEATAPLVPPPVAAAPFRIAPASSPSDEATPWPRLRLELVVDGLLAPTQVTHAGDGSGRLFVTEQRGVIRALKQGILQPRPFLDITDRVGGYRFGGHLGLLSMAVPPPEAEQGCFYVYYTNAEGSSVIARFRMTGDPDAADPTSEEVLLTVKQLAFDSHKGGQLAFGPRDGYLYVGVGDGGWGGDPQREAQNLGSFLGKILRLDVSCVRGSSRSSASGALGSAANGAVNAAAGGSSSLQRYAIPPNNPFLGVDGALPEIWALGLRNPWRFSFDRETGDLYVGDVGEHMYERIVYQPGGSSGGLNYGWPIIEGARCFDDRPCTTSGLTLPVATYDHGQGCAVIGGAVYRGAQWPLMRGLYFYADFCTDRIWGLRRGVSGWQSVVLYGGEAYPGFSSFGEGDDGTLYAVEYRGTLYRLVEASPSSRAARAAAGPVDQQSGGTEKLANASTERPGLIITE